MPLFVRVLLAALCLFVVGCKKKEAATKTKAGETEAKKPDETTAKTDSPSETKDPKGPEVPVAKKNLPDDWPKDVPIPAFVTFMSHVKVRARFHGTFQAKGKTVKEVVDAFQAALGKNGWSVSNPLIRETSAVLPFTKGQRKCGLTVANHILNERGELDKTSKGITIQVDQ